MSNEEIDFINEFERTRQIRSDINEQDIKAVLEALKPLIAHNLNYLKYTLVKYRSSTPEEYLTMSDEQKKVEARDNALTTIIGRLIQWNISEGRELAYKILEETNDHKTAENVKPLLF